MICVVPGEAIVDSREGWYQRVENNGWRPVASRIFNQV